MMDFLLSDQDIKLLNEKKNDRYVGDRFLSLLEKRTQEMIELRFGSKWSLQRIANRYGISRERVRQIIGNSGPDSGGFYALRESTRKIKKFIKENGHNMTTPEIANALGVAKSTISHHMSGIRHPVDGNSSVAIAYEWENWASRWLKSNGIRNKLMPLQHPFDILAFDQVRIDVKVCTIPRCPPSLEKKLVNPQWVFHVKKNKRKDTDFYCCIIGPTEEVFIIPSLAIARSRSQLVFSWPTARPELSKWQHYLDAYDLVFAFREDPKNFAYSRNI